MKPCRIVRLGGAIVLLFGKFRYLCDAKIGCGLALLSPFAIFAIQRQRTVLSGTVAVVHRRFIPGLEAGGVDIHIVRSLNVLE